MQKTIFCFLLNLVFLIAFTLVLAQNPPLHVCTVASKETQGLKQLLDSCNRVGIKIDVLGAEMKKYRGNGEKLLLMIDYLKNLPGNDLVLFVDAYDVLIVADEETIINNFLDANAPFVISVERNCWPFPRLAKMYPKSPTSFFAINSGSYIGYVWAVKNILNELQPINPYKSDQGAITLHYFNNRDKYKFDYYCELFLPLFLVREDELIVNKAKCSVTLRETQTTPCIIHGNGTSIIYQDLYDFLFLNKNGKYKWLLQN